MQPDVNKLKQRIRENRDLVDKIASKLPGFKGYADKSDSHDADKMIREIIVDIVKRIKNEVNAASRDLVKGGKYMILPDFESLETKLETLIKKCGYAASGSTTPVSRAALTEDDKSRLLEYDWKLISAIEELEKTAKDILSAAQDNPGPAAKKFEAKLNEFESHFDERKNILREVL